MKFLLQLVLWAGSAGLRVAVCLAFCLENPIRFTTVKPSGRWAHNNVKLVYLYLYFTTVHEVIYTSWCRSVEEYNTFYTLIHAHIHFFKRLD